MPLLKFKCSACMAVFDELVSAASIPDVKCPACGGNTERAYEGKCLFGDPSSSAGRGASCFGNCGGCAGCGGGGGDD